METLTHVQAAVRTRYCCTTELTCNIKLFSPSSGLQALCRSSDSLYHQLETESYEGNLTPHICKPCNNFWSGKQ